MQTKFADRIAEVSAEHSQICVGLDPSDDVFAAWNLQSTASSLLEFSKTVIASCVGRVGFVKPQVSFYERFGVEGFVVLTETLKLARECGLFVIADAKRGDIGSSMRGYASAWLGASAPFRSDALTVSSYLGVSSLYETAEFAQQDGAGLFVLAATSNPEASEIQTSKLPNGSLANHVVALAKQVPSLNIGVVIGATQSFEEFGIEDIRKSDVGIPILSPGFGAQGAQLRDLPSIFGSSSHRVIASVSRSVLLAGPKDLSRAISESKNQV